MAGNRFKKNLDKDKTKEIVGNNIITDETTTEDATKKKTSTKKKTKKDDTIPVVDVETETTVIEVTEETSSTEVIEDTTSIEETVQDTIEDTKTDEGSNEGINEDNDGNEGYGEKDSPTKNKNTKKNKPVAKLRDGSEAKKETVKLGVSIKESTKDKVDMLAEDNSMKANEVVVELLNRVFDGKDFTVNFDKKEDTKITSFNIPPEINKAIEKVNKKTGIPKSEVFNKLLDEAMKEFYNN